MARRCTICTQPRETRDKIDRALVADLPVSRIAAEFRVSDDALTRHRAAHLPAVLLRGKVLEEERRTAALVGQAEAQEAAAGAHALDVREELRRALARVNKLFDAADEWLTDPEDAERYTLAPRAEEVTVIWDEDVSAGDRPRLVRRKARLAALLQKVAGVTGAGVVAVEVRHADPRELLLRTAERLQAQLQLLAVLTGQMEGEQPQVNILLQSIVEVVKSHVIDLEARRAVAVELARIFNRPDPSGAN